MSPSFASDDPPPPGFPLPAIDAKGNAIATGATVFIPKIPHWLVHNLPAEDAARLMECEGTSMRVFEIDAHGFVWFGELGWFCLRPDEVEVVGD